MILRKRLLVLSLPLLIAASLLASPGLVLQAHASLTGIVCLRDPSGSAVASGKPCSGSSPTFDGPAPGAGQVLPTQLRIGVYVNSSDALDGFDITLLTNHTVLHPVGVDLTGTVVPGTTSVIDECLGGVNVTGPRCPTTDTVDTLQFAVEAFSLITAPPTTGLLFTAIYNITGTSITAGMSVGFQTGCVGTSDAPLCVTISNGTTIPDSETIGTGSFNNHTAPPWVAVSSNSTSLTFVAGNSAGNHASILATAKNGWPGLSTDSVSFIAFPPTGLTATFLPVSCSTGGSSCSVVLSFNGNAGNYTLTIYGQYVLSDVNFAGQTDTLRGPIPFQVTIRDFSFSVSPSSLSFNAGGSGSSTVTLTSLNHFAGSVSLQALCTSSMPAYSGMGDGGSRFLVMTPPIVCPSVSLSLSSVSLSSGGSGASILTVSTPNSYGNYSFSVSGQYSSAFPHSVNVGVVIGDFNMSAVPLDAAIAVSKSATSTISLASLNGFAASVSLSAASVPTGLVLTLTPSTLSLVARGRVSSVLNITAPSNLATGTYVVTVTATSGGVTHTAIVDVEVGSSGFTAVLVRFLSQPGVSILAVLGLFGTMVSSGWIASSSRSKHRLSRPRTAKRKNLAVRSGSFQSLNVPRAMLLKSG